MDCWTLRDSALVILSSFQKVHLSSLSSSDTHGIAFSLSYSAESSDIMCMKTECVMCMGQCQARGSYLGFFYLRCIFIYLRRDAIIYTRCRLLFFTHTRILVSDNQTAISFQILLLEGGRYTHRLAQTMTSQSDVISQPGKCKTGHSTFVWLYWIINYKFKTITIFLFKHSLCVSICLQFYRINF